MIKKSKLNSGDELIPGRDFVSLIGIIKYDIDEDKDGNSNNDKDKNIQINDDDEGDEE